VDGTEVGTVDGSADGVAELDGVADPDGPGGGDDVAAGADVEAPALQAATRRSIATDVAMWRKGRMRSLEFDWTTGGRATAGRSLRDLRSGLLKASRCAPSP
jgi:hypothetical protein